MNNAALVGIVHGPGDGLHELSCLAPRRKPLGKSLVNAGPVDKFECAEGTTILLGDGVNLNDVGMLQTSDGLGFGQETCLFLSARMTSGADHLQSYDALQVELPGSVDNPHPTAAQLA